MQTHLYVHVSLADLATHLGGDPAVGEVEKLGPATLDLIQVLAAGLQGHHPAGARPEQVPTPSTSTTRHRGCANRSSSATGTASSPGAAATPDVSDLDHTIPYVPPDEGGPPGQTNPQNLAPLCRRHHRAKTFTGWTYERARDGTHTWTSPHGHTWTVGPDGTTNTTATSAPAPDPADRAAAYTLAT